MHDWHSRRSLKKIACRYLRKDTSFDKEAVVSNSHLYFSYNEQQFSAETVLSWGNNFTTWLMEKRVQEIGPGMVSVRLHWETDTI